MVDDRLAEAVTHYLDRSLGGVEAVWDHGTGCCCKHCPHGGNCR